MNVESEHLNPEELEVYKNAETVVETAETSEEESEIGLEAALDAIEADPALGEALDQDVADAAKGKVLDDEQREALSHAINGLAAGKEVLDAGGDLNYSEMIEHMLQERYDLSIQELLSGFQATNFERLFSYPTGTGFAQDLAIFGSAKAMGVELKDMSVQEKTEVRWKVGADVLKVFGLIAKFIPQARVAAIPFDIAGGVMGRSAEALEGIRKNPESTNYDAAKALTLATLPRDKEGNIDMKATAGLVSEVGGMVQGQENEDQNLAALYELVGGGMKENPEVMMESLQKLDTMITAVDK